MNRSVSSILRKKATKSAVYGGLIAFFALIIATFAASYLSLGSLTLESILHTQKTNPALWVLYVMPFVFMFWGQYASSILVKEAATIIINKRQQWSEQFEQKNYDTLTQLPNASQFLQELDRAIQKVSNTNTDSGTFIKTLSGHINQNTVHTMAVILFDIDNFKEINSALGSLNGDVLLKEIGLRLKNTFKDSDDSFARVGGDDFAILKVGSNQSRLVKEAKRIRKLFDQPFSLNGVSVMLEISLGISVYPQHGDTPNALLQHAEIAMYSCKKEMQEYTFYSPSLNAYDLNDLLLKTEIRRAFDNNELCLHFQPKVNVHNQVNEVEALVRWNHPEKGLIPPDKFVPIIVRKRLNGELLQRILALALNQAKKWEKENIHIRIALNLTAFDLLEPDLPVMIEKALCQYGLKTDILKLEITETTLVEHQELTLKTLTELAEMGIPTSIDDFGTGYSSLSYLSRLPINEIKIDRSFVMGMVDNHRNDKIIQAIIALAHSLSLCTVAEGVENAHTMGHLKNMDCDFIQGYHISKPLDGKAFTDWLRAWDKANQPLKATIKKKEVKQFDVIKSRNKKRHVRFASTPQKGYHHA